VVTKTISAGPFVAKISCFVAEVNLIISLKFLVSGWSSAVFGS